MQPDASDHVTAPAADGGPPDASSLAPGSGPAPADGGRPRRSGARRALAALVLGGVFVAGIGVGRATPPAVDGGGAAAPSPTAAAGPTGDEDRFALIREAWDLLHEQYVGRDELDDRDLVHGAIDGMTEAVGDTGHTSFMTPEERAVRNESLSGSYVGIGVQVDTTESGLPLIVGVFPESPAAKGGLRSGDVITAVDGQATAGHDLDTVVEWVRGEVDTAVTLTVRQGDTGPERTVRLVRSDVRIDPVSWTIVPGTSTGLLRLEQFSNGAADQVVAALGELREAGADRLVLDLRGNPGGYVGEAVGIASQFLESGTVYVERNAQGETKENPVSPDGAWTDLPVVVLVDAASASSSEIVAGALQDHDRATLVGVTTFGTGTVLGEFELGDGSALRIGTVEWLTPDGRRIWHEGIAPDVVVERASDVLPTTPADLRDVDPGRVPELVDAQLERALELVGEAG